MLERVAVIERWLAQQYLLLIARLSYLSKLSTIPAIAQWIEREQWYSDDEDEILLAPMSVLGEDTHWMRFELSRIFVTFSPALYATAPFWEY